MFEQQEGLERWRDFLRGWASFLGANGSTSDVVQDAMLRGYRQPHAVDLPYLIQVVRTVIIDRWRRQKRRRALLEQMRASQNERSSATTNPLEHILAKDLIEHLAKELDPRAMRALILRHIEGRSYAEVADNMEVSTGTVSGLLARAIPAARGILAVEETPCEKLLRFRRKS